jgi:hypothetical protein
MAAPVPDPEPAAAASGLSPGLSQRLAYEFDEIGRIITVVYIGTLTDADVVEFYRGLMTHRTDAADYDFLLDMRYTSWSAQGDTIAAIGRLFDDRGLQSAHRIAVVRKDNAATQEQKSALKRQGIGQREIRYFETLRAAQDWLSGLRPAGD